MNDEQLDLLWTGLEDTPYQAFLIMKDFLGPMEWGIRCDLYLLRTALPQP